MNIEKRVRELVEERIIDKPNLFIVDVKLHPNGRLIILVDGEPRIDLPHRLPHHGKALFRRRGRA